MLAWKPGDKAPTAIATGAGSYDGVVIARGRIFVSSWKDSTVSAYETGQEVRIISGVGTADIGYDAKRNRLLLPFVDGTRLEIWQLP